LVGAGRCGDSGDDGPGGQSLPGTPKVSVADFALPVSSNSYQVLSTVVPTVEPVSVCGEPAAWNVLVLGSDAGDLRYDKGSDLTRIFRVDFPNRKATIYAFPRDLWVDTAGLGLTNPTMDATQLGAVFYEARSRSTSTSVKAAMVDGTNATARMLAKNFLISTDHYLTIDLIQLPAMVDAIGGVSINIPVAISGRLEPLV
jgi:anionic cell wall polymer biosynthesis LytR-Cps2A-Psr (LCP) family protein